MTEDRSLSEEKPRARMLPLTDVASRVDDGTVPTGRFEVTTDADGMSLDVSLDVEE